LQKRDPKDDDNKNRSTDNSISKSFAKEGYHPKDDDNTEGKHSHGATNATNAMVGNKCAS
jgi:hypothetical protein